MKTLKKYLKREMRNLITIMILSFLGVVLGFVEPQIISKLLIALPKVNNHLESMYPVLSLATIIFLLDLANAIFYRISFKLSGKTKISISKQIEFAMARKLMNSRSSSVMNYQSEELISRIRESYNFVNNFLAFTSHIWNVLIGLAVLIYSAFISLPMFVLYLLCFIAIFIIQKKNYKKIQKLTYETKTKQDTTMELIKEAFDAFLDIKVQHLESGLQKHYKKYLTEEQKTSMKTVVTIGNNNFFNNFIKSTYLFLFLILSSILLYSGQININHVIVLFMYRSYINNMVNSINSMRLIQSEMVVSETRINQILCSELEEEQYGSKDISSLSELNGDLSIQNVTVKIEEDIVLNNINLQIPANQFVGIVGSSGCGKSTLAKVIAHEIIPDNGSVFIDDININELSAPSLRKAVRMVAQKSHLFSNMSIRENLLLANQYASDEAIWRALSHANITELVKQKGCLDTVIDPNKLSGGELQRLALARLALQKAKILLLDESTSALDNLSQAEIVNTLKQATSDHTIIMIAHRLSTIKDADMIVFMDDGKILDTGTYNELYEKNEQFRTLADN